MTSIRQEGGAELAGMCGICQHPKRAEIDQLLASGATLKEVTGKVGRVRKSSLSRHRSHLFAPLKAKEEAVRGDTLLAQVRELQEKTELILKEALEIKDHRLALSAVAQARGNLELLGRILGQVGSPTVNITLSPEWSQIRVILFEALIPFPEARVSVAKALKDVGP